MNNMFRISTLGPALLAVSAAAIPAHAQVSAVSLTSEIKVEKAETDAKGVEKIVLKSPQDTIVVPGDKLVVTLDYKNNGALAAANFVATNPLPSAVQFVSTAEGWAEVSTDGGKSFGKLAAMTVDVPATDTEPASKRAATAADVTTIRWVFAQPIPAGGKGKLTYRGVVK